MHLNTNSQTAVSVLCDASTLAFGRILLERGIDWTELDAGEIAAALRTALKARIESVMADWSEALAAGLSEGWLRQMVNAQALEVGLAAAREMGLVE